MKEIIMKYEKGTHKWYLYIDGNLIGKYYTLLSMIGSFISRELETHFKK